MKGDFSLRRDLLKHRRIDLVVLFVLACLVFVVQSLAWPLSPGRDAASYLMYYLDIWTAKPVFQMLMLYRTPVAPLFFGTLLQFGGSTATEIVLGICFALSILATYSLALLWGRRVALVSAIVLMLYPGYGLLYHEVDSDGLFAFVFVLWLAYVARTLTAPTVGKFMWHGVIVALLALTRPSAQILLLFAAFPLLIPHLPIRQRLLRSSVFLSVCMLLLLLWSVQNLVRYDDFTVSRSGNAQIPLYRVFIVDRLVRADNGPASARLAEAIKSDLLTEEPYRSYAITLDTFLSSGDSRMWGDLVGLCDRIWGWDTDYRILRDVALEAIWRYPLPYSKGVALTLRDMLFDNLSPDVRTRQKSAINLRANDATQRNEAGLPLPSEGQMIPASRVWWLASSPNNRVEYDWEYYLTHGILRLKDADMQREAEWLEREAARLLALPARDGLPLAANVLNGALGDLLPPMPAWILAGLAGFVLRRDPARRMLAFLCGLGLTIVVITSLESPPSAHYRIPFDPAFIVFGVAGLAALLEGGQPSRRELMPLSDLNPEPLAR